MSSIMTNSNLANANQHLKIQCLSAEAHDCQGTQEDEEQD